MKGRHRAVQQALAMMLASSSTRQARRGRGHLNALIYRGRATGQGIPEVIGKMLRAICPEIKVTYAGPDEATAISATTLRAVDIFAHGGSPDRHMAWKFSKPYVPAVREYVAGGGIYLGFCLDAFSTGRNPGFGLLPADDETVKEIQQPDTGTDEENNEFVKVNWELPAKDKRSINRREKRCVSSPDGTICQTSVPLAHDTQGTILGTYSYCGNIAAMINPYGDGWVANIGAHPEVDFDWLDEEGDEIKHSEGFRHDIAYDFVQSMLDQVDYYGDDPTSSETPTSIDK